MKFASPNMDQAAQRGLGETGVAPSPPSDGGEGRGEEGHSVRLPLSSVLSPLLRRGERKNESPVDEKWVVFSGSPSTRVAVPNACSLYSGETVGNSSSAPGKTCLSLLCLFVANKP